MAKLFPPQISDYMLFTPDSSDLSDSSDSTTYQLKRTSSFLPNSSQTYYTESDVNRTHQLSQNEGLFRLFINMESWYYVEMVDCSLSSLYYIPYAIHKC